MSETAEKKQKSVARQAADAIDKLDRMYDVESMKVVSTAGVDA